MMDDDKETLEQLTAFHGHLCPGLAIGYRATLAGLRRLGVERARDEELIAIVENDSCSVDAVQYLAGATFGKGNLYFRDWGKQVFTFARRDEGRAVRVSLRWGFMRQAEGASKKERTDRVLAARTDELFDISETSMELPAEARIMRSVRCDGCGEPVMESRADRVDGRTLCRDESRHR
jgi:formylmethanofuran dehydrogenase subunit E